MQLNPRTPVLIGVGQVTNHPDARATYEGRPEPLDLMVEALTRAANDAGPERKVLESIEELVAVGSFTWHTNDPALLVCQRLGLKNVATRLTPTGGTLPQKLVHENARRILAGEITTVALVGAEAEYTRSLARRQGHKVAWTQQGDDVARAPKSEAEGQIPFTKEEYEQGLTLAYEVYPLFENARRARLGWSFDTQREHLGRLWANFAQVAATNPFAWIRTVPTPEEVAYPSAANRMVSFPYTKLLTANLPVDMGASYVMTSYENAITLGVARERMVFPQCGADATDHWYISERPTLDDSPAMRALWRALNEFGANEQNFTYIDLYSCFPTVVQSACDVLGIDAFDPQRVPTLTGGLTFAGGPGNNYTTHSIATVVNKLRDDPSSQGLVTGLGWFATKHSWGAYAATPPAQGFRWYNAQAEVDALAKCDYGVFEGDVTVETYTVSHGRDVEARRLIVAARNDRGVRTWCHSTDPTLMKRAETEEIIGLRATINAGVLSF
jgi:acetyl-CoA C-acetyltransferase